MIEGLQIIAFLAYQLLTLHLWADHLSHTPFSQLSHTAFNIIDDDEVMLNVLRCQLTY